TRSGQGDVPWVACRGDLGTDRAGFAGAVALGVDPSRHRGSRLGAGRAPPTRSSAATRRQRSRLRPLEREPSANQGGRRPTRQGLALPRAELRLAGETCPVDRAWRVEVV